MGIYVFAIEVDGVWAQPWTSRSTRKVAHAFLSRVIEIQPPRGQFKTASVHSPSTTNQNGGNGDGVIDSRDSVFASLGLWQDTNHNGTSEPGELQTLADRGVTSISLEYVEARTRDRYGNPFKYRAKVSGGKQGDLGRWAYDVFLISPS